MSDLHAATLEDEPRTPMWLPALGAALFVAVGLWWAVTPAAAPRIVADTAPSAAASAAPPPQAARSAMPMPSLRPPGGPGAPGMPGAPAILGAAGAPSAPGAQGAPPRRLHEPIRIKGPGGQR